MTVLCIIRNIFVYKIGGELSTICLLAFLIIKKTCFLLPRFFERKKPPKSLDTECELFGKV